MVGGITRHDFILDRRRQHQLQRHYEANLQTHRRFNNYMLCPWKYTRLPLLANPKEDILGLLYFGQSYAV